MLLRFLPIYVWLLLPLNLRGQTADKPYFVVVRWTNPQTQWTMPELRNAYQQSQVAVWQPIKPALDTYFEANNTFVINDWQALANLPANTFCISDLEHLSPQFKVLWIDGQDFFEDAAKYPFYQILPRAPFRTNIEPMFRDGLFYTHHLRVVGDELRWVNKYFPDSDTQIPARKISQTAQFDFEGQITKLMLTGVSAITRRTGAAADTYGVGYLTEKVRSFFQNADWVHLSNEVSIVPDCQYASSGTKFCTKEAHFQALLDLRVNIVELTGNHNSDYGRQYFDQTLAWYKAHQMPTFGGGSNAQQANEPLIITLKDGKKIGFIGFNEQCPLGECAEGNTAGANRYEAAKAQTVIQKMRLQADFIIASVQFRERDSYEPRTEQVQICRDLADFGVDMVYGSQAHQVQQVAFYNQKPLFYGLGNFLFDQQHHIGVRQGFFLKLFFYQGKLIQAIPVFTMIDAGRPVLATPSEADQIKAAIWLDGLLYPTQNRK